MNDNASRVAIAANQLAKDNGFSNSRVFVKRGPPAGTIVAFGKEKKADIIVLGSRGIGDLEQYLLGSVSHKVASLANCLVLMV